MLIFLVFCALSYVALSGGVCGAGPTPLIEISPTLALAVCSDSIIRVVKVPAESPVNASTALLSRKSLMLSPGQHACGLFTPS